MRSGHVPGRVLKAVSVTFAVIYLVGLIPAATFGLIANADYAYLGCPGASQCSDAAVIRTAALIYFLAGPVVFLFAMALRALVRAWDEQGSVI